MKTRSEDLQLLLAVVDSGSFSAAADVLGLQVSKISRAVSRLEKTLNSCLIVRTTRRLELTEEGRQFIDQIRPAIAALAHAEESLNSQLVQPEGRLRVDAASPFMLQQVVPHIAEFQAEFPKIKLELTSYDNVIDLLEKRTDLAFRVGALSDSSLHARLLGQSQLHLVATPDYLKKYGEPDTVEHLVGRHKLLGFVGASRLNVWPLQSGLMVKPDIAVKSGTILRALILENNGIGCLSNFMVQDDIARGRLVPVMQKYQQPMPEREQVSAVFYRNTALSPRIRAFLDFFESRLRL
ncbi:LysR family transcriptional regulator [Endozoicomonadaceae bacterium StTr2]